MTRIETRIRIAAPANLCFDIARDIDLHTQSLAHTAERAVAGATSGLIGMGESVTWEARHLGARQRLTSRITAFDPPRHFRDTMTRGAFKSFVHDHFFEQDGRVTVMRDVIEFASPLGPIGRLVDRRFMSGYLRRLIEQRGQTIRAQAERRATNPVG